MPSGGQLFTVQPLPSDPPVPVQLVKPVKLLTWKWSPRLPTSTTSPLGFLIVTLHDPVGGVVCVCVPPGHCASENRPPALLDTLNVKSCVGHTDVAVGVTVGVSVLVGVLV